MNHRAVFRPAGNSRSKSGLRLVYIVHTLMHMEKELGVPKPGDLFIGVIDFFAVLVPGVIAAALIVVADDKPLQADILFLSGLAIAGWVLGHVLHGIGSFLDPLVYDRLFRPQDTSDLETANQNPAERSKDSPSWSHRYLHKNDDLYRLAKEMTDVPEGKSRRAANSDVPGGMYQWARTWLDSHSPEVTANLDRLEADSKLFRSLVVLCLIAIPVLIGVAIATSGGWTVRRIASIVIAFAGVLFSLWRYCDLRNKMIRRCYLYYVQRRFESRTN